MIRTEVTTARDREEVETICNLVERRGLKVLQTRSNFKTNETWITAEGSEEAWTESIKEILQ